MKILIAEDDSNFQALIKEVLTEAGHEPMIEENGLLAWNRLQKDGADMAILDVNMPEMDGFDTCSRLRQLPGGNDVGIVIVTGLNDVKSIRRAYEVGAT
ncbi:MAG: response regulator, partial [Elusimicrobiales bacterium]|nr:response regulator [Elusimicrobiales bacterium]